MVPTPWPSLERIYVNAIAKLKPGYSRHVAMLRDDGIVFDDGVLTRLAAERFFLTTSTARAADVQSWFEFLAQTAWPDLKVHIVSVTDQWAAIALAGPLSGRILAAAFPALDTSDAALPKMGSVEGRFAEAPLRIHRMSYSGERAYELYVGARQGEALAIHLEAAGAPFGLKPYGVDAMGALRIEKGYAAGGEIDGTTTLEDIGLGMVARPGGGFVGAVLRKRPALTDPARRQLVGLECVTPGGRLRSGAILFNEGAPQVGHGIGHITAITYSPDLGRHIALALLTGGSSMIGRTVIAASPSMAKRRPPEWPRRPSSIRRGHVSMSEVSAPFHIAAEQAVALIELAGAGRRQASPRSSIRPAGRCRLSAGCTAREGDALIVRITHTVAWVIDDAKEIRTGGEGCACDLSHSRVRLALHGGQATAVLAKVVALDLDLAAWPAGAARSTAIHGVPVLIHRAGAKALRDTGAALLRPQHPRMDRGRGGGIQASGHPAFFAPNPAKSRLISPTLARLSEDEGYSSAEAVLISAPSMRFRLAS